MDASYKIQRGIHVHLIQFFMCPEFWVHIRNGCPALYFLTEGNVRCSLYIFKELLWKSFRCGRCTHGSVPKRNNFLDRKDSSERRYQFE